MNISNMIIPIFLSFVLFYGILKGVNIYESFLSGTMDGLKMLVGIIPPLIAMIFAINIFIRSNFISFALGGVGNILSSYGIPKEILPMAVLRPISGTASLAIMNNIFLSDGPDSFIGRLASTIQGCSDTTIYVLALYFTSVNIKKIRHSLYAGLFADFIGILFSFIVVRVFFL